MMSKIPIGSESNYGSGGGVSTKMGLRGMDLPPLPDFWGDWERLQRRRGPHPREQARSLREYGPTPEQIHRPASSQEDTEPIYGVPGLGGVLHPYIPGLTPLGPGQQPVMMGTKRRDTTIKGPAEASFAPPASAGLGASGAGLGNEPYDPWSFARRGGTGAAPVPGVVPAVNMGGSNIGQPAKRV